MSDPYLSVLTEHVGHYGAGGGLAQAKCLADRCRWNWAGDGTMLTAIEAHNVHLAVMLHMAVEPNPHLPAAPEDGKHDFNDNASYRCMYCAVYNRPDVPSTKEVLDNPCVGRWDQSGKLRYAAEDKWLAELIERVTA